MANAAVIAFHNENMAKEKERVRLRIANGTKASSPQIISYRRQHPDFHGIKTNPKGSFNALQFKNKDETHAPFASEVSMSGGVIKDFRLAQKLLKQRATSSANIQLAKEGAPPLETGVTSFSEIEAKQIELNQLLGELEDVISDGVSTAIDFTSNLRRIFNLYIQLLPIQSSRSLTEFLRFFGEVVESALPRVRAVGARRDGRRNRMVVDYFSGVPPGSGGLIKITEEFIPYSTADTKTKNTVVKALVQKYATAIGSRLERGREADRAREAREEAVAADAAPQAQAVPVPAAAPEEDLEGFVDARGPEPTPAEVAIQVGEGEIVNSDEEFGLFLIRRADGNGFTVVDNGNIDPAANSVSRRVANRTFQALRNMYAALRAGQLAEEAGAV